MTTTLTDSDLRGLGFALGRYRETCPDPHAADNMAVRVLGSLGADERQNDTLDSYYLVGRVTTMTTDNLVDQLDLANIDEADVHTLPRAQRRYVEALLTEWRARQAVGA